MTVYVCLHCEYRFDTEKGDPAYNIPAGKLLQTCLMTGFAQNAQLLEWTHLL